ncbi:MAG TPA: DUF3857 domain-containing protein, partial [Planctomycetes bacterium]|nr:DUF3857 domain-containing protein [Planctomycetota bacterium]
VFALGWRDQNDAGDYIDLLLELGRPNDARSAVDRMRRGGDVLWVHQLAARIHRSADKCEEAVSILRSYAEARPGDREAKLALLDELTSCKREEEAIALADTYITGGRGDAGFLLRRGIAECQLGRFPHAKRTFENALELEPHDVSLQNWLDHATRELGQGSNQLIRRPLPPLDLPAAHEPTKNELSAFRDEAAVYADSTVVYEFRRGESLTWTARDVIHILTAKGVEEFSTIRQPFDPESQEFFVNEVRVRDEKGDTVSVGRLEDYFVKDDDSREAKSSKVVNIPVVGLAPGRTLEYVRTRRLHGSPQRFDYRRIPLGAPSPIMRSMVEVGGDIEDIQIKTAGEPVEDRSPHRLRIVAKDLPACPVESYAPRADTWQPMVWLSEASGTWEEVAREYLAKIEERLQVSEEIEKLARTLTEGAADARDRAQALSAWVQRKIHYKSIAFGPKAWLPERPEKVLEACWGDCKGHALLFHHLMKAVGLRAHLALVSTSDVGWPELPSTWQFDHMINYCPDLDDGRFVDCVDKGWGWDASVPSGLDRQPSLVLDPEAPRLLQIPAHGDTENLIELDRDVICEADGTLKVSEVLRAHANLGGFLRRWLLGMAGGERAQAVASWLQQMDPRIAFERVAIESLEDTGAPIALRLAYGISRGLEELDGRRVGKAPAPLERCYLVPPVSTCRRAPVEIAMPYLVKSRSRIRPSDSDTTLEAPSLTDASGEDRFTRWSSQARSAEGGLEITGEIATLRGRHPAERYEEFRASTLAAVESLQVRIVVT